MTTDHTPSAVEKHIAEPTLHQPDWLRDVSDRHPVAAVRAGTGCSTRAAAIAVVGLTIIGLTTSLPIYFIGVAIGVVPQGIYLSVDLALIAEILPDKTNDNAKDFGVMALANQLPQTVSPAVAPLFLAIGFGSVAASGDNYTAFFLGGALFAALSVAAISRVKGVR